MTIDPWKGGYSRYESFRLLQELADEMHALSLRFPTRPFTDMAVAIATIAQIVKSELERQDEED